MFLLDGLKINWLIKKKCSIKNKNYSLIHYFIIYIFGENLSQKVIRYCGLELVKTKQLLLLKEKNNRVIPIT